MADLIIKGGSVLTVSGAIIDGGAVVVENGLITFVGKDTKVKADKTIDAKGCAVMPGLINAHTHLPMTLFRGYADGLSYEGWMKKLQSAEMRLTPADVRAGAYLGVLEMIRSGTTAFADMYIHMDEVAQVVEETGMRAALGYGMIEGRNEDSNTKLKSRADFARKWNGAAEGRIKTMYAPHSALSCSKEFLIRVKDLAAMDNAGVHMHVLETEDELNMMKKRYGMCTVKLLDSIGMLSRDVIAAHCVWLSGDDIRLLGERGVNVAHCPASNMNLGVGVAPVPEMLRMGVNVALGTDGAASSGSLDMWKEMRASSLMHGGAVQESKVLEMATANGARAMGIKAGVLAPGYLADIIVVDMKKLRFTAPNPVPALVHGAAGGDVRTTIINGKVLMKDYRVEALDENRIIDDARNTMEGF